MNNWLFEVKLVSVVSSNVSSSLTIKYNPDLFKCQRFEAEEIQLMFVCVMKRNPFGTRLDKTFNFH